MRKTAFNTAKRRFTLVELLVSMGVLVIILGFILQFFVGSQRLWQSMEQRNNLYADARVAMDVMTTMLQNSFYSEGGIPFRIDVTDNHRCKIYFATQSKQNLPGSSLKYVSFQLGDGDDSGEKDELKLAVFCSEEKDFSSYFPPYGLDEIYNVEDALKKLVDKLDKQLKNTTADSDEKEPYGSVLVRGVTSFEIIPYELDTSKSSGFDTADFETTTDSKRVFDEFPFLVELRLTMLSPADFKIWQEMGGFDEDNGDPESSSSAPIVEFRKTHAYTFSRTVFIGEQSRMNINE